MVSQMQQSRYELKYIVDEACAAQVASIAMAYLQRDPYNPEGGGGYPVHSLYLDGQSLPLCRATLDGHRERYKLRLRWYDDNPSSPVFCEIKRRNDKVIRKERVRLDRSIADRLAGGLPLGPGVPTAPADMLALQRFCSLRDHIGAVGSAVVSYEREAFVSPDNSLRITIDRNLIACEPDEASPTSLRLNGQFSGLQTRFTSPIVELKFTSQFPTWMSHLVRDLQLDRCSVPKYVACAQALDLELDDLSSTIGRHPWIA